MIDPKIIRERRDDVRKMLDARSAEYDLDALVDADTKWRSASAAADGARQKRNEAGRVIAACKKRGEDADDAIRNMQDATAHLESLEAAERESWSEYVRRAKTIPNMIHDSVPVGADDSANVEVRTWGKPVRTNVEHVKIMERRGLVDIERAAKVAGSRFYYLRGDMVTLNHALVSFALDFAASRGYTAVQPPYMISRDAMEGSVIAEDFEDAIYKIDGEDLYMIGTSEHAIAAMHGNEILEGASLPARYAGVSACFRKEAGAHGKDQKGIFRVHQFDKVEQFTFARPDESWKEHERMLRVAEDFYRELEIPFRTMLLSSGDMGKVSAKTYDIEGWMAGQGAYREMVSCSNCLDYQARRLMIRFRDKTNEDTRYVHTLNSTLVATTRTLVSIAESCIDDNGKIVVPHALQKYVGKDKI